MNTKLRSSLLRISQSFGKIALSCIISAALGISAAHADAVQTYYWYKAGADNHFGTPGNWFLDAEHTKPTEVPAAPITAKVVTVGSVGPILDQADPKDNLYADDPTGSRIDASQTGITFTASSFQANANKKLVIDGHVTVQGSAFLWATVNGSIDLTDLAAFIGEVSGDATSRGNSALVPPDAVIHGNAKFFDFASPTGDIRGTATFERGLKGRLELDQGEYLITEWNLKAASVVGADELPIKEFVFHFGSRNGGVVPGNATFFDSSKNGGDVTGDATFLNDVDAGAGKIGGKKIRRFTSSSIKNFDLRGWTVVADGTVVDLANLITDATTILVKENGGSFKGLPLDSDLCPNDPNKLAPGQCGCGTPDIDSDRDGVVDCLDTCPNLYGKTTSAGICGCSAPDVDSDDDGTLDCQDACPDSAIKSVAGACGCNVPDTDTDGDTRADCVDACPADKAKVAPGQCGCGVVDTDTDRDGIADCKDLCPADAKKSAAGSCGCGKADTDLNANKAVDCIELAKVLAPTVKVLGKKATITTSVKGFPKYTILLTHRNANGKIDLTITKSTRSSNYTFSSLRRGRWSARFWVNDKAANTLGNQSKAKSFRIN